MVDFMTVFRSIQPGEPPVFYEEPFQVEADIENQDGTTILVGATVGTEPATSTVEKTIQLAPGESHKFTINVTPKELGMQFATYYNVFVETWAIEGILGEPASSDIDRFVFGPDYYTVKRWSWDPGNVTIQSCGMSTTQPPSGVSVTPPYATATVDNTTNWRVNVTLDAYVAGINVGSTEQFINWRTTDTFYWDIDLADVPGGTHDTRVEKLAKNRYD